MWVIRYISSFYTRISIELNSYASQLAAMKITIKSDSKHRYKLGQRIPHFSAALPSAQL